MQYALALVAALLVILAVGLGFVAVCLGVVAGTIVAVCALALGAAGSLFEWTLALSAVGVSWPAVRPWRRFVRWVREAVATAGPGIGRPRGG
ncbi:MAG TPA: hypothetical protein ENN53_04630 [Candidatus Acetothermia bacterium]|nr:hypothetical protein [Candidatus Acetothermia bacterium]